MGMWFTLGINSRKLAEVTIHRLEALDVTDPHAVRDEVCTYEVNYNGQKLGTVQHRYGDGKWSLLQLAAGLIDDEGDNW